MGTLEKFPRTVCDRDQTRLNALGAAFGNTIDAATLHEHLLRTEKTIKQNFLNIGTYNG